MLMIPDAPTGGSSHPPIRLINDSSPFCETFFTRRQGYRSENL